MSDMVTALQSAVSGDAAYTTAQTALVSCMNGGSSRGSGGRERVTGNATTTATSTPSVGRSVTPSPSPTATPTPTYSSFDDILSRYTGDTKAKMDEGGRVQHAGGGHVRHGGESVRVQAGRPEDRQHRVRRVGGGPGRRRAACR